MLKKSVCKKCRLKDRLPWAKKNAPEEVDKLKAIIKNNGEGREPVTWQRKLEKYK
ncbi:hypothetical protein LCGC14_1308800 [marine sediment metagenome]|uniref:Uncharacterized protein n=1 Tax=marine sediment metagenome TaxID=412755 RepID=A0A0F9KN03_9ZZZZ